MFNILSTIFLINSIILIILIIIQNDTSKDSITNFKTTIITPLEIFTWISLVFELSLMLVLQKNINF